MNENDNNTISRVEDVLTQEMRLKNLPREMNTLENKGMKLLDKK